MAERDDGRRPPDDIDPEAPASPEEVAASQRLRDALAGGPSSGDVPGEVELALALKAAWDPGALTTDESRAVLDATPSAEELELAAGLRDALAAGASLAGRGSPGAELAVALRSAFSSAEIDDAEHRAMVEHALAKMAAGAFGKGVIDLRRRGTIVRVTFGVMGGGLALAASVLLAVTSAPLRGSELPLAKARTTQPLFSEPFREGEASARIDCIASARASDYRANRFTKWGVR